MAIKFSLSRKVKISLLLVCIMFLSRGFLYRSIVTYDTIGMRETITDLDPDLVLLIENEVKGEVTNIEDIARIARRLTSRHLQFSFTSKHFLPNVLVKYPKTHCKGYSYFFNAIANYLISKYQLDHIKSQHMIGTIEVAGIDIHRFFNDSFYKNHDFNLLWDVRNGNSLSIDPSLYDYLGISTIRLQNKD